MKRPTQRYLPRQHAHPAGVGSDCLQRNGAGGGPPRAPLNSTRRLDAHDPAGSVRRMLCGSNRRVRREALQIPRSPGWRMQALASDCRLSGRTTTAHASPWIAVIDQFALSCCARRGCRALLLPRRWPADPGRRDQPRRSPGVLRLRVDGLAGGHGGPGAPGHLPGLLDALVEVLRLDGSPSPHLERGRQERTRGPRTSSGRSAGRCRQRAPAHAAWPCRPAFPRL